jgi:hypothetical protein
MNRTVERIDLIIDGQRGNQFLAAPPPFFTVPSWWRRFVFQVLSLRDLAVYCYLCSLTDKNGIAFPTQSQIASEMGLEKDAVISSVRKLHSLGFMLRELRQLPGARTSSKRTVYQRPAPEFTLLRLIKSGIIGAGLAPVNKSQRSDDERDTSEAAVISGLKSLLGPKLFEQLDPNDFDSVVQTLEQRFTQRTGRRFDDALADLN